MKRIQKYKPVLNEIGFYVYALCEWAAIPICSKSLSQQGGDVVLEVTTI